MGAIDLGIALAATQHGDGTIPAADLSRMSAAARPRQIFIQGVTLEGKTFRPSDWAERLAGAIICAIGCTAIVKPRARTPLSDISPIPVTTAPVTGKR